MKPLALVQTKHLPFVKVAKSLTPPVVWQMLYKRLVVRDIADADRYGMVYQPWLDPASRALQARIDARTLVSPEGCWHLASRWRRRVSTSRRWHRRYRRRCLRSSRRASPRP